MNGAYARKLERNKEYYYRHHDRILSWQKEYRKRNFDAQADRQLKWHYGITFDEFLALAAKTDDHCPICKDRPATHVDHDHDTGKIRGILCNRCNAGIGILGDSVECLESAKQYLLMSSMQGHAAQYQRQKPEEHAQREVTHSGVRHVNRGHKQQDQRDDL